MNTEANMKNDPYIILRRFQDWRLGLDVRPLHETGLHKHLITEAIDAILAEHGLANPLTVCRNCLNFNENTGRCESEEKCAKC